MKIYDGNVEITESNCKEWSGKLKGIEKITGDLYIYSNADLKAPQLKTVGGYLYINSNADLKAPQLKTVGGDLYIYSNADLKAPQLKTVGGYLYINSNADLKALKTVGGDLSIYSNADLKALKTVGGYLYINSNADLKALKTVGGDLSIYSNADLKAPQLKTVGGYLYINSNADLKAPQLKTVGGDLYTNSKLNEKLEKQLWENNKKRKWYMSDDCSEYLLSRKGKIDYRINNVDFKKKLFDEIRKGQLTASQVFKIKNMEQRRVAYEKMDKVKMKGLDNYEVVDELDNDGHGHPLRLVSFNVDGFKDPFKFLNCVCPSTDREYFIETQQNSCVLAKERSFGLDNGVTFDMEW